MDLETAITFTRSFGAALLDSTRTDDLLTGEEISSVGRMPALEGLLAASDEGRAILRERPRITSRTVDFGALRRLPAGALGRAYAEHLDRCGLDVDALSTPVTRGRDDVANYLLERVRQTHDIWHTLLGLGTAGHEEVLVHAFQWPQLRMPYSALVVTFGTLKHVVGEVRWRVLRHGLREAVTAGRRAAPLLPVYWERHWEEPLTSVRQRLRVTPLRG
jgi:ubiquinone biosynthesis protein COQ4